MAEKNGTTRLNTLKKLIARPRCLGDQESLTVNLESSVRLGIYWEMARYPNAHLGNSEKPRVLTGQNSFGKDLFIYLKFRVTDVHTESLHQLVSSPRASDSSA